MSTALDYLRNNQRLDREKAERVLIVFELADFFIGDTICGFCWLRACQSFFPNALIEVNCVQHHKACAALLRNNPHVSAMTSAAWECLDFARYDVILLVTDQERQFLHLLTNRYGAGSQEDFRAAVFSYSILRNPFEKWSCIFPFFQEMRDYIEQYSHKTNELYIDEEEKAWADQWLRENGLRENDKLLVVLDSTSNRSKFLRLDVHFEVLQYFLGKENVKVLVFDEKGIGKKGFYTNWLGADVAANIIFGEKLNLRQAFSLLASSFTRLILGPSTGLMHGASGIYNVFMDRGMPAEDTPIMITYVGYDTAQRQQLREWAWWGDSLVDCILVKKNQQGHKEVLLIDETNQPGYLACHEFTRELLVDFINTTYRNKLTRFGIN